MCFEFIPFLQTHWQDTKDFFNSTFFTAIAGSLAGAFAGAYGAQRIAERGKQRNELLKEIHNTNSTIMVAFGICNSLLSLKKQHVKSLKDTYDDQKAKLKEHLNKKGKKSVEENKVFKFTADLQSLSSILLPLDVLQKQAFEKMSLKGRPLSLVTTLDQTVHSLNTFIEKRNQLIELYKANQPMPTGILLTLYFGLQQSEGHIDQNYPGCIDAIYSLTDDGIFFSSLLCDDLVQHGNKLAKRFSSNYGKGAPTINEPDFTMSRISNLMPDENNYKNWSEMFIKESKGKE